MYCIAAQKKLCCLQSEEDLEEEEHILGLDDLERRTGKQSAGSASSNTSKPEVVLESNQDAAEWKLEVERVMPQLLPDKKRSEKSVCVNCLICMMSAITCTTFCIVSMIIYL